MRKFVFTILRKITVWFPWPTKIRDLLMWPIASRVLPKDYTEIIKRPGYIVKVDLKDQLNRMLLFYGPTVEYIWEPQTTKLAQYIIKNAKNSIVAGSHIGLVNLELLTSLSSDATIYTFEPADYLFKRSTENLALNNCQNRVKLAQMGLSNTVGEATFYVEDLRSSVVPYSGAHTRNNNVETVKMTTIDAFKAAKHIPKLDFLFLDIEGLESLVFKGAEHTLTADQPIIIFEVSPKILSASNVRVDDLYSQLTTKGYTLYAIEDNYNLDAIGSAGSKPLKLVPIDSYTIRASYCNVLASPPQNKNIDSLVTQFS